MNSFALLLTGGSEEASREGRERPDMQVPSGPDHWSKHTKGLAKEALEAQAYRPRPEGLALTTQRF